MLQNKPLKFYCSIVEFPNVTENFFLLIDIDTIGGVSLFLLLYILIDAYIIVCIYTIDSHKHNTRLKTTNEIDHSYTVKQGTHRQLTPLNAQNEFHINYF